MVISRKCIRYFRRNARSAWALRAHCAGADILLLDEPTAGLDPISSGEINELVLKLQQEHQMASIVVTHDLHSAKTIATRLALLDKGNVVIEGNFEDLQQSPHRVRSGIPEAVIGGHMSRVRDWE